VKAEIPNTLIDEAAQWEDLHRWERKQLGMALRRLGLTYSEIQDVIPVPSSTLSNWCRDVTLSRDQREDQCTHIPWRTERHTAETAHRN
jgi:hypothetical protein